MTSRTKHQRRGSPIKKSFPIEDSSGHVKNPLSIEKKKGHLNRGQVSHKGFPISSYTPIKYKTGGQKTDLFYPGPLFTANKKSSILLATAFIFSIRRREDRYGKAMCGYKIYKTVGLEKTTQVLRDSTLQVSNIILCQ